MTTNRPEKPTPPPLKKDGDEMKKTMAGGIKCENKQCKKNDSTYIGDCGKYGSIKQNLKYEVITKKIKQCKDVK